MANLIKKQILKVLTKFTQGLQPEDIQLSSLKGEAELRNISLDTEALQSLLDLPTWVRINCARVNSIALKIQWTSLQSKPIRISLDHIELEAETLQEPRPPNGPSPIQDLSGNSAQATAYGFTEKVYEGIRLEINAISIKFNSVAFQASVSLQQIIIFSARENWSQAQDLRETRKQDEREVLMRKKIQWNSVRVEATWKDAAPVRLITNQGEIRILLRRRCADCGVLATRVEIILDDLLWILSDRQIQATLLCVKSLSEAIEASKRQSMQNQRSNSDMSIMSDQPNLTSENANQQLIESSHHFRINRLDLHICEESVAASAVQVTLTTLCIDYYPGRKAARSRKDFSPYTEAMKERDKWIEGILQQFRDDFKKLREVSRPADKVTKLKENVLIVRLHNAELYQVSSPSRQNTTGMKLLSSAREHLPENTPFLHFETTDYYTPDGRDYPMPHNNVYIQVNGLVFDFDFETIAWFHKIVMDASETIQKGLVELGIEASTAVVPDHQDVRIDIIMPSINLGECQLRSSRLLYMNTIDTGQLSALDNLLDIFKFTLAARNGELTDALLSAYVDAVKGNRRPIDVYLENVGTAELCREALILPQAKEIAYARIEKFWIDVAGAQLLQPASMEAYIEEQLIMVRLDKIMAQVNHEQLVALMTVGEVVGKLVTQIEKQTPTPTPPSNEQTPSQPQIEVLGRGVVIDLDLVPYSSLLTGSGGANHMGVKLLDLIKSNCHLSPNPPFVLKSPLTTTNGDPTLKPDSIVESIDPTKLAHSTARVTLTPIVASVTGGVTRLQSRLGLETRTHDAPNIERHSLPSLNGSHVLKTLRSPHLIVNIGEAIGVTVQNVQLALINSILADIGPFFESPFPPAEDGGPIEVSIDNVTITLEPDQPVFYEGSIVAPLDLVVEWLKLRLNPDGSITVVHNEQRSLSPSSIRQKQPTPPPRPSMSSRPMSTQTRHMDENVAALYELQERNMSLQREREALSEALGKMQDELIKSEERSETYRSQLQAMKQLINHQKRY